MSEEWPWTWSPLPTSTRRIRDLEEELAQVQRTADERARQLSEQDKEIERLRTKVERFQFDKAQVLKADAKNERLRVEVERLRAEAKASEVLLRAQGETISTERARIDAALALHQTRMGGPFCPECGQRVGKDGYCTSPTVKALKGGK